MGLSWTAVSGATSYRLYRDGHKVYDGTALAYTDSGLLSGWRYCYTVQGREPCGEGLASPERCATATCALPPAPATVTAIPAATSITVSWTAAATPSATSCTGDDQGLRRL